MLHRPPLARRWATYAALATLAALAPAGAVAPAPNPNPGPSNVLAVHQRLFRALETGDRDALRACFSTERDVELLVVGEDRGEPIELGAVDHLGSVFSRVTTAGDDIGWTTTITRSTTACPSGSLAAGTLEFERRGELDGHTVVRRYRSTALLRNEDGALRIFHWHLSPAERFVPFSELDGGSR